MAVKTRIIRIGNSQGVRIPKLLLDQAGIGGEVELDVRENQIIIHSVAHPRQGWDQAFNAMAERGDDTLLDAETTTEWDETEWEWE